MGYRLNAGTGVVTYNGASTSSGEWSLIESRAMTGSNSEVFSNVFTDNSQYTRFRFVIENCIIDQSYMAMYTLDNTDTPQSYTNKGVGYTQSSTTLSGTYENIGNSWALMRSVSTHASSQNICGEIFFNDPNGTSGVAQHKWWCAFPGTNAGEPTWRYSQFVMFAGSASWTGVEFRTAASNLSAGTITVYGA